MAAKDQDVSDRTKLAVGKTFLKMYREAVRHQIVLNRQRRKTAKYLHIAARRIDGWAGRNCAPDALVRFAWESVISFVVLYTVFILPFRLSFLTVGNVNADAYLGWKLADITVARKSRVCMTVVVQVVVAVSRRIR